MLDSIWARFSPDGKRLVYHERRHQDGRVLHFAVVQNRDGTGRRDLISFDEVYKRNAGYKPNGHPCWSPDGTSVAWLIPRKKLRDGDTGWSCSSSLFRHGGRAHRPALPRESCRPTRSTGAEWPV